MLLLLALSWSTAHGQDLAKEIAAVRFSVENVSTSRVKGTGIDVSTFELGVFSPIFYKKIESWSLGAAARYEWTDLEFTDKNLLEEQSLHALDLPLFLAKEQSEELMWFLLFNPTLASDFDHIENDSFHYLTIFGARYKTSETFQWLLGALYSTGYDDDLFLPALGFQWKLSEQAQLLFAGPVIRFQYSLSEKLDWILFSQPSGTKWNTRAGYGKRDVRMRGLSLGTSLQWEFTNQHSLILSAGWQLAREIEIKDASGTTLLERDLETAPFVETGYRYHF
ncbi:MAG: DUF6268 family outer membrane beta-barrel protein [Opitutales bacterium]